MLTNLKLIAIFCLTIMCIHGSNENNEPVRMLYTMPNEDEPHEGTWLQWPHSHQYGPIYRDDLDPLWIAMTRELKESENVHIIAFDKIEEDRIKKLILTANISLTNIDFYLFKTNDVWIRDGGPIFVKDAEMEMYIEDYGFNGWGNKVKYQYDDKIPKSISEVTKIPRINLREAIVNEGGSICIHNGMFLATKSSILNNNRNPNMTQSQAEAIFTKYLSVEKFIWLDGKAGTDITDMHIDGVATFVDDDVILTMSKEDLLEMYLPEHDIEKLYSSTNKNGVKYRYVTVPLTEENVVTTYGKKLNKRGSYVNYYISNTKILVPNYNDASDGIANSIIQKLYPTRKVVGLDARNLCAEGGMIHCVTKQQPK